MSERASPKGPNLITVDEYIERIDDEFGVMHAYSEVHKIKLQSNTSGGVLDVPHTTEAWLRIPLAISEKSGETRRVGPRELRVEAWSDDVSWEEALTVGRVSRWSLGSDTAQFQYAESVHSFNTRRILNSSEKIDTVGLDHGFVVSDTNTSVLAHLSELTGERVDTVKRAAEFVTRLSLEKGASFLLEEGVVPVKGLAEKVRELSGVAIPKALLRAPNINYSIATSITEDDDAPSVSHTRFSIDDRPSEEGVITEYLATDYFGAMPVNVEYLELISYASPNGCVYPLNRAIDVRQSTSAGRGNVIYAETPAEARQMISGLYNSVSQLRGYITRSLGAEE